MKQSTKPLVSRKEVAQHNKPEDLWIIIKDKVYDVPANWLVNHPGGRLPIMSIAGKDATDPFVAFHDEWVMEKKLQHFHVANLIPEDCKIDPMLREYREMEQEFRKKGYFQTNYLWYLGLVTWIGFLFCAAWGLVLYQTTLIGHILAAVSLGMFFQQSALLGHDFAHNAFTHNRYFDTLLSTSLAIIVGISCQWWKHTHNVHHVVTNSLEFDPDIQHLPVIAITEKYFKNVYSKFHGRVLFFDSVAKFFVKYQSLLYYPIMCVSRFNLYLQGIIMHLKSKDPIPFRVLDFVSIIGYFAWYIFLVTRLPTFERQLMFFIISHVVTGLLSIQITISHFAMPVFENLTSDDFDYNFLKVQFEHSMDVDCPWWLDWLHGGLQFQLVHHLFPRIPRHNLRFIRDNYILPFAKKWNLKYDICTFTEANVRVVNTLKLTSLQLN